jgi:hypothetical protein
MSGSRDKRRLAIVFSDEHTIDIIPLLRPQIDRHDVENGISFSVFRSRRK